MPEYEGFVACLKDNGKAEVLIRPEISGIAGAPEISRRVCHCASSSSQVAVQALNPLRAGVGDRVSVMFEPSLWLKNAAALIGVPLLGLILGLALSTLIPTGTVFRIPVEFISVFAGLSLGVAIGVVIYRRFPKGNAPLITRIIRARVVKQETQ